MFGAGLRRAEAAALDLADYDPDNGTLRVIGKRDRERTAYVVKGGRAAVDYWLRFRGDDPGPLLVPVSKSGTITLRRMTTQGPPAPAPAPLPAGRGPTLLPARPPPVLRERPVGSRGGPRHGSGPRGARRPEDDPPLRPPRRRGAAPGRDAAPRSVPRSALNGRDSHSRKPAPHPARGYYAWDRAGAAMLRYHSGAARVALG